LLENVAGRQVGIVRNQLKESEGAGNMSEGSGDVEDRRFGQASILLEQWKRMLGYAR
jgi:hypothetical protein